MWTIFFFVKFCILAFYVKYFRNLEWRDNVNERF